MSESKHDESFKVVDRRLFTPEGEFRKEVAESGMSDDELDAFFRGELEAHRREKKAKSA